MLEIFVIIIGIIAIVIQGYGFFRLLKAHKAFLSGWYQTILKGIAFIAGFLALFIIVDVIADYVFYFVENTGLYTKLNLAVFILALLTTLSLAATSLINIRLAKEYGFK